MKELAAIQRAFMSAIEAEAVPPGVDGIRGDRVPAGTRLAVYRRNFEANHELALADAYPVVRRLVGAACFAEAARRYTRRHPPRSGNLDEFGESFPQFLAAERELGALAYLPDVARLEWRCHEAFHAADGGALDFGALEALPPERHDAVLLQLHPAVRLVRSDYPVLSIWEANQPGSDGRCDREDAESVLVRREDFVVRPERLTAAEWAFLAAIEARRPLGDVVGSLPERDARAIVAASLPRWVRQRVVDGFSVSPGS